MGVRWKEERKKRRDRMPDAQDEEGRLKRRSAQPPRVDEEAGGCCRGVEGGPPDRGDLSTHSSTAVAKRRRGWECLGLGTG